MNRFVLLFFAAALVASCGTHVTPDTDASPFAPAEATGELRGADMLEASGLAASQRFVGHWWTVNDSGYGPHVHLIDGTGQAVARVRLDSVANRDWEDLAWWTNPATGASEILVAEIGDNRAVHETIYVYAFAEPDSLAHAASDSNLVAMPRVYPMTYPDGARDAETLMVDPSSNDWYLVSKRENEVRLYRYPHPQRQDSTVVLEYVSALPITMAVGGDISRDGTEILVKTYDTIHYWKRATATDLIMTTLAKASVMLPYVAEPQGESIAFATDGSGFATVSEAAAGNAQPLLIYRRK